MAGETSVGALPGLLGVGVALSCTLTPLWRWRLRLLLTAAIAISVMYIGHLEQVALACGAAAGLVVTALTYDRAWPLGGTARAHGTRCGCWSACSSRRRPSAASWPRLSPARTAR